MANPDDPYSPVRRFVQLVEASSSLRGCNTTYKAPLGFEEFHRQLFEATDTELVYLPDAVKTLVEEYPDHAKATVELGHFEVRTRENSLTAWQSSTAASVSRATTASRRATTASRV